MAEAKLRALTLLKREQDRGLVAASQTAYKVWPEASFRAQGAGGAGSRILRQLELDGLARWIVRETSHGSKSWGWEITGAGRKRLASLKREARNG